MLLIIVAISLLILLFYCGTCFMRKTEGFQQPFIDYTVNYLLSDSSHRDVNHPENPDRLKATLDNITGPPTLDGINKANQDNSPVNASVTQIDNPITYNAASDKEKTCRLISACGFYAISDYQGCTSCMDSFDATITNAFYEPEARFLDKTPGLKKTGDCPCTVRNLDECKNVQRIVQCEKIKSPYSTIETEDCGFVFFSQGAKNDYDTGVALSKTNDINFIRAPTDTCNSLNKQDEYINAVVMPNPRYMVGIEGRNLSEKIKNWIAKNEDLIYDEYTNLCSPELNNNGNNITRDCALQKFTGAGGIQRGKDYPSDLDYDSLLKRINVKTVEEYDIYIRALKEGLNSTGDQLIRAQEALLGIVPCKSADNIVLSEKNSDYLWKCFRKAYPSKLCKSTPDHEIYPHDEQKTLNLYKGMSLKQYKDQMTAMVNNVLQGFSNRESTATKIVRKDYEKCIGKSYSLNYLDVGSKGKFQSGFDVIVFNQEGMKEEDLNKQAHAPDILNHVVLPSINFDSDNIIQTLGTSHVFGPFKTRNPKYDIRCLAQGQLHFSRKGNYYFRIIADDAVQFKVDTGREIKNVLRKFSFKKKIYPFIYYGFLQNVPKDKIMPFNLTWYQTNGVSSLKFMYRYLGDKKISQRQISIIEHSKQVDSFWKIANEEQDTKIYPALRVLRSTFIENVRKINMVIGSPNGIFNIGNIRLYDENNNILPVNIKQSDTRITHYGGPQYNGLRIRFNREECQNTSNNGGLFNGNGVHDMVRGLCLNKNSQAPNKLLFVPTPPSISNVDNPSNSSLISEIGTRLFNETDNYELKGLHTISFYLEKPLKIHKLTATTSLPENNVNSKIQMSRGKNYIHIISAYTDDDVYDENRHVNTLEFFTPFIYPGVDRQSLKNISYKFSMYPIENNFVKNMNYRL